MDRWLLGLSGLLFCLGGTLFLADFGYLPFLNSGPRQMQNEKPIGRVIQIFQHVKRKSETSLIWESSASNDTLFENDSILTLDDSSTRIELEGDIRLDVHQNTLVVLESPETQKEKGLLLKFSKGHLRGQSEHRQFRVGQGPWTFNAKEGSNISLRSLADDQVEIEVSKGEVELHHPAKKNLSLKSGERLQVSPLALQPVEKINQELSWQSPLEFKVYSHTPETPVTLAWKGEAQTLTLEGETKDPLILNVKNQSQFLTHLPLGRHHLFLKNETGRSSTLMVQVLPAPKFFYLSPLPRDRINAESAPSFFWMKPEVAHHFTLQISSDPHFSKLVREVENAGPGIKISFDESGDFVWRVVGYDSEGFMIPAPYIYPLFSVDAPLEAPQILPPQPKKEIRRPAEEHKGSWWINLLWSRAMADEKISPALRIEWTAVKKADFYVVEISSRPDFIDPEVTTKVKETFYEWTDPKQAVVYFRVAGEQNNGKKGLFSNPLKIDLSRLSQLETGEIQPGVTYVKKGAPPKPLPKKVEIPTPLPEPFAPLESEAAPEQIVDPSSESNSEPLEFAMSLFAGSRALWATMTGSDFKSNLMSWSHPLVDLRLAFPTGRSSLFRLETSYSQLEWKPKNKIEFQPALRETPLDAKIYFQKSRNHWGWGFGYAERFETKRAGYEELQLKKSTLCGVALMPPARESENWRHDYRGFFAYGDGGGLAEFKYHPQYVLRERLLLGPAVELTYWHGEDSFNRYQIGLSVLLGFEW